MSAIDDAFHGLRAMIASGELQPGQRIPTEGRLCEQLGVSRGPLREAVRMLGALGVIESRHGSGTYVSALEPSNLIGALSLTLELMPPEGLLSLYEVRRVIEAHATAQAASRITDRELATLVDLARRIEGAAEDDPATDLDGQFHDVIADASGNPATAALLKAFRSRVAAARLFERPGGHAMKHRSDEGHREILAALTERDPAAAAAAAAAHVAQT